MKFWQKSCMLALVLGIGMGLAGHVQAGITSDAQKDVLYYQVKKTVPVKILADYRKQGYSGVVDFGTFTKVDNQRMFDWFNARFDGNFNVTDMPRISCSCCIKPVAVKGEQMVLFGRNMDLPVTHAPAFVFRINEPGKYKSVNIGYMHNALEPFDQIVETGTIDEEVRENLICFVTDFMNEKGLVLETNMRDDCAEVMTKGTNPGKPRMNFIMLPRYLADNCANIEEVLAAVKNFDFYTMNSNISTWHIACSMMDATGRFGTMELVNNKVVWHEGYPGQTNYWIDSQARKTAGNNLGIGRWAVLMAGYNNIKTMEDMRRNMEKTWYSQVFDVDAEKMSFDPAMELAGCTVQNIVDMTLFWQKEYGIRIDKEELARVQAIADEQARDKIYWDNAFLDDPTNFLKVYTVLDFVTHAKKQLPPKAKKLTGMHEASVISYVVNNKEKVFHTKFFAQPKIFHLGIDK